MIDLRFVSSEDMLRELQSRFDESVFVASARDAQKTDDLTIAFFGPYHACMGLIEMGKVALRAGAWEDNHDDRK